MKKIALFAALLLAATGCKDETEPLQPQPKNTGSYLLYTTLPAGQFDQLELKVAGAVVGTLTAPFVATGNREVPVSSMPSTVVRLERPEGTYELEAVATLKGQKRAAWSTSLRFETGKIKRSNFQAE
ncbi:hypothetical protein ACFQ4C_21490 [Larkinella insperata]|uniref:Lipoprotein n=1 Tax=Larkinella insperata TaxID=332158 RepID=A0ABW3Q8M6_9BACT